MCHLTGLSSKKNYEISPPQIKITFFTFYIFTLFYIANISLGYRMNFPHIVKYVSCTSSNLLHQFCCPKLRSHGYPNKYVGIQPPVDIGGVCRPCLGVCCTIFLKVPTCVTTLYGCLKREIFVQKVEVIVCFLVPTMPSHHACVPSTFLNTIISSLDDSQIVGVKGAEYGGLLSFTSNSTTNGFRKTCSTIFDETYGHSIYNT